LLVKFYMESDF